MKYLSVLTALFLSLAWTSVSSASQYEEEKKTYLTAAQSIIDMVNSQNVNVAAVEESVLTAVKSGIKLARAYAEKHPEGKDTLEAVIRNAANAEGSALGEMSTLSFDVLEADWHDAAYFTRNDHGVDLQDEANEHYLDPIHTIVHPLMVLAAAKDYVQTGNTESLNAMKAEMQEGMEQVASTANVVMN